MNDDQPVVDSPAPDNTSASDDQEWADAAQEFQQESGVEAQPKEEPREPKPEPTPEELSKEPEAPPAPETLEKPPAEPTPEQPPTEPQPEQQPQAAPDTSVRDARATEAVLKADREAMEADVREKLFSNVQTELKDADGDPIKTIEDVQKLINPKTNQPFTAEEAGQWLLGAQRHIDVTREKTTADVQRIADLNLTMGDQAQAVLEEYKDIFDANPGLKSRIWQNYQQMIVKDPETEIITDLKMPIKDFYDNALEGYVVAANTAKTQQEAEEKAAAEKAEAEKKEAEEKKKKQQTDREDVYSAGKSDTRSDDDKEWDEVAKEHYEG